MITEVSNYTAKRLKVEGATVIQSYEKFKKGKVRHGISAGKAGAIVNAEDKAQQQQNETSPVAHKLNVKAEEEEEEEYTSNDDDLDRFTVSQFLLSRQNPVDSSPMVAAKKGSIRIKRRELGLKQKIKKIVSDNAPQNEGKRETFGMSIIEDIDSQSSRVMERAAKVQASLSSEFPSFIKLMRQSHVTKGFWLGLPSKFCKLHLPRHDETVVLEDERGKKYYTTLPAGKDGLGGGWKGFSTAQTLVEGDAVVFHLVSPLKFKVYIIRANDLDVAEGALGDACAKGTDSEKNSGMCEKADDFDVAEGALGPLDFDACAKDTDSKKNGGTCEKAEEEHSRVDPPDILLENVEEKSTAHLGAETDQSESHSENVCSLDMEGFGLSSENVCSSTANFENFKITVNGLEIDSKLSTHVRAKYYELCSSQKSHLHDHLLKSLNYTLAVGIISETVDIADAITDCKITNCRDDFEMWDKTLKGFEQLGMSVGFLRAPLNRLVGLALELTEAAESRRLEEARAEREGAEEELRSLKLKYLEVTQARRRLDDEIEVLEEHAQRYKVMFVEEASAPW